MIELANFCLPLVLCIGGPSSPSTTTYPIPPILTKINMRKLLFKGPRLICLMLPRLLSFGLLIFAGG